ncbi:hypothetical protein MIR68_004764 [Amoeboaphelidium protococcarum]|nr:hypothetical protein MIR68_004764 [Amoeboaphelidium protococcarum]
MVIEGEQQQEEMQQNQQFGTRYLTDPNLVYEHNAWDNVQVSDEMKQSMDQVIERQRETQLSADQRSRIEEEAQQNWDQFYRVHNDKFFKNRKWLHVEFPELFKSADDLSALNQQDQDLCILEAGCGVGNSLAILNEYYSALDSTEQLQHVKLYGCDFAQSAVDVMLRDNADQLSLCRVFQHDITKDLDGGIIAPGSLSYILLIFCLSAIPSDLHEKTLGNLYKLLKPGGVILFRDYAKYDMTQIRFKKNRYIEDGTYIRGDSTMVHFFDQQSIDAMAKSVGFESLQSKLDSRLLVNRQKKLQMYRMWIQCKWRKPIMLQNNQITSNE